MKKRSPPAKGGFTTAPKHKSSTESSLQLHLKVNRGDSLCMGTAVHMLAAAARSHLLNDKGFLYPDVTMGGSKTTYLSESFVVDHFSAVLQIHLGELFGFPKGAGLVRLPGSFKVVHLHYAHACMLPLTRTSISV